MRDDIVAVDILASTDTLRFDILSGCDNPGVMVLMVVIPPAVLRAIFVPAAKLLLMSPLTVLAFSVLVLVVPAVAVDAMTSAAATNTAPISVAFKSATVKSVVMDTALFTASSL